MGAHSVDAATDPIDQAIATLHGVLPDQGPIGVFVHHNTLHALQHLPFEQAVEQGAAMLGTRAWPAMSLLRSAWRGGRIHDDDVAAALTATDEPLSLGMSTRQLHLALLRDDIDATDDIGMDAGLLHRHHRDPLFARALAIAPLVTAQPPRHRRHRDVLYALTGMDSDEVVQPDLVRLSLSFLDRGQAQLRMPQRERGFLFAAADVLSMTPSPRGAPGLAEHAARIVAEQTPARDVLHQALIRLGVDNDHRKDWLVATALALRGLAGMFSRFERHPDETDAPTALMDFLALRVLMDSCALASATAQCSLPLLWPALVAATPMPPASRVASASLIAALATAAGHNLDGVTAAEAATLVSAARSFTPMQRNRVLFTAYEASYRRQVLSAMAQLRRRAPSTPATPTTPATRPVLQVMFCIDEREESIRRALEEQGPAIETFGTAGFFGMAIDYQGVDDHESAAYCPVVVTPGHEVNESPVVTERRWHAWRRRVLSAWHHIEKAMASGSRGLLGGAGASVLLGPAAGAMVAGRVLAPRASLQTWKRAQSSLLPAPATRLSSSRTSTEALATVGKPMGFSTDEAADRVTAQLMNTGLATLQARLVVVLGHGSTSLNNPHESAHDCGACGGRRGGANARLFAELANRGDVRAAVRARGVTIAEDTWFVGGLHDTSDDSVQLFDLESVPLSHAQDIDTAVLSLDRARKDSAQERCRRFLHADMPIGVEAALAHVEARASHLGQPRPEYGHCTNAMAVVGRRSLTRGLHLDRRAFLISYDPTLDSDNNDIAQRILAAVGPVGAGINLEYYFSSIDNEGYGCGTKLPHNVTGLLGVMNGHQGDLRTGLPLQMVELHEPMRLLLIVEATPASLLDVAAKQAEVRELVVNGWVQLVSVDPVSGAVHVFDGGAFVPFVPFVANDRALTEVARSVDWHGRSREFVGPAIVTTALSQGGR